MQIKEFLENVCAQIKYQPIRKEISEEIQTHIEEIKEELMAHGKAEKEAEELAIQQMGKAEEIGKKLNKIHRPKCDWKLLLITLVLLIFGGLVAFTRSKNYEFYSNHLYQYGFTVLIGMIFSVGIYFFDYRKLAKYAGKIYVCATLLILLTLQFGVTVNGATKYFCIAGISISVVVPTVPMYMIAFIGLIENIRKEKNITLSFWKKREISINLDILKIMILSGISLLLFIYLASLATVFVLGIVYVIIATVKLMNLGKKGKKYVTILWGSVILVGILLIIMMFLGGGYRRSRLITSFFPESDPAGGGWVGINQKIILESANWLGEADDMSNAINLFDEGTDFAFISLLAHYGWIVSLGVLMTIIAFSIKLIWNAMKIKDMYGKLLIVGISSFFILQSIFHLLMNLNLGIKSSFTMAFISYGNMNLIINMMCLSLILSIYRRKDILLNFKKVVET